jgi:hypothetical protein
MYIQVILNLNQQEKRLGNKFTDILKNLNSVYHQTYQESHQKLDTFLENKTKKP